LYRVIVIAKTTQTIYAQSQEDFYLALGKVFQEVALDKEQRLQEAMAERILSGTEEALMRIQARETARSHPRPYHNRK
jgi:hypothetical protein